MHALRTRFQKDIIAEFLPPASFYRRRKNKHHKEKVIILCSGAPSVPSKKSVLEFFSRKGYWVFFPRFRGSWESGGKFLQKSPHEDVLDIISELPCGFRELWGGAWFLVKPHAVYVIGSSFGGPAAILALRDKRVAKAVVFSPVVDWQAPSKDEPLDLLEGFIKGAFGNGYRFTHADWKKLAGGAFYNPVRHANEIDGARLLIVHARDDAVVRYKDVAQFAKKTGAMFLTFKKGGHFGLSFLLKPRLYGRVQKFLNQKNRK